MLGAARWQSIDEMVRTEVESTPLVDRISDDAYLRIQQESRAVLGQYQTDTGCRVPLAAHLVIGRTGD